MSQGGLMIMAGGTGGHVFPALAVAQQLQAKGVPVRWMGTQRGLEARVVPQAGIPIDWITIEGMRGSSRASLLLAPFKLLRALWQAARILMRHRPQLVLGMGGFVAGPGGLAARLLATPLVIHEQNAVAGLTNRYLAKIASRVLTGFPNVIDLPANSTWVGNPVRQDIQAGQLRESKSDGNALRVLVIGGSQGALSFNRHLPSAFAKIAEYLTVEHERGLDVWHQSGRDRHQPVEAAYANADAADLKVRVSEFVDDMAEALQWADLVVCRAGAMTIAELCAAAKPSILVPYPFSAGDHQDRNADFLVAAGGAVAVGDADLKGDALLNSIKDLINTPTALKEMAKHAGSLHKPNALDDVVAICEEWLNA